MCHPLETVLARSAAGSHPAPDGGLRVLTPPDGRSHGVFAFTAHHLVVADVTAGWVAGRLPAGDLSAPLNPPFLAALEAATGRRVNNIDLVLVTHAQARPVDGAVESLVGDLVEAGGAGHARVARAERYRTDVRAWTCDGGLVLLGRGVAGRWEVAAEVAPRHRGRRLGRALFAAARHLLAGVAGPGEPLWAQVAPGNVASVRALLAAGYRPAGAEALLVP